MPDTQIAMYECVRGTQTGSGWRRTSGKRAFHQRVIWRVVANVIDVILDMVQPHSQQ